MDTSKIFRYDEQGTYTGPSVDDMGQEITRALRIIIKQGGRTVVDERTWFDEHGRDGHGEFESEVVHQDRAWLYPHTNDDPVLNVWKLTLSMSSGLDDDGEPAPIVIPAPNTADIAHALETTQLEAKVRGLEDELRHTRAERDAQRAEIDRLRAQMNLMADEANRRYQQAQQDKVDWFRE